MEKTYPFSRSAKTQFIVLGVISCLTVLMIPFGILLFWMAAKGAITIRDNGMRVRWIGTRDISWDEFEELRWLVRTGRAAAGPVEKRGSLVYKLKGQRAGPRIALQRYENAREIIGEIQKRTGLTIA